MHLAQSDAASLPDASRTPLAGQQGRFEFTAGVAGVTAKRVSRHIGNRRALKWQTTRSARRNTHLSSNNQSTRQSWPPASSALSLGAQLSPSASQPGKLTGSAPTEEMDWSVVDHTQHMLSEFANMTTTADKRKTHYMSLGESHAAWFRHPDLTAVGQRFLANIQTTYGVTCDLTSQAPKANQLFFVNNLELQASPCGV